MNEYDNVNISRSTVFKQSRQESIEFLGKLEQEDSEETKEQEIEYSGVYCYDEQYVFINKELYYRLALIDANTKQIIKR